MSQWSFHLLYHTGAWAYDGVASVVSFGRWYAWVQAVRPFIRGPRVLEVGPGTGHLLELLTGTAGLAPIGVDESQQMLHLVRRRCGGRAPLIRGTVQNLPIQAAAFDTIVSTFPTDFIQDLRAVREFHRVLHAGGRLVILPVAQLGGQQPLERLMAWALAALGETPRDARAAVISRILPALELGGFLTNLHELTMHESLVFVIIATKPA